VPKPRTTKADRTVSTTVSLPLSVVNAIDEEAMIMGRGFSDALAVVVRIGLDVRRTSRLAPGGEKT